MKKKGDISMNTIVMAAIALIVLVVLTFILTGRVHWFTENVDECKGQGTCMPKQDCEGPVLIGKECDNAEYVCCGTLEDT